MMIKVKEAIVFIAAFGKNYFFIVVGDVDGAIEHVYFFDGWPHNLRIIILNRCGGCFHRHLAVVFVVITHIIAYMPAAIFAQVVPRSNHAAACRFFPPNHPTKWCWAYCHCHDILPPALVTVRCDSS